MEARNRTSTLTDLGEAITAPKGSILRKDMKYPVRAGANQEDQEELMKAHVKLYRKHSLTIL